MIRKLFLTALLLGGSCLLRAASPGVAGLQTEYSENPLGVDAPRPQLNWQVVSSERGTVQSAYEIRVGTDSAALTQGKKIAWSSKKKSAAQSAGYEGKALAAFTRYFWQVRVWNAAGEVSPWSGTARWETAALSPADWKGEWIGDGRKDPATEEAFYEDEPAPLLRKNFSAAGKPVREARLYIAGLGYYEASLNGARVGDQVLDPGWTNFSKEVLYSTYDVTELVGSGKNVLGVTLGNGFYNPLPMRIFKPLREFLAIGRPCLRAMLRITYTDGQVQTVVTDESWQWAPGPVLRNNVYLGEHYDARKEIPGWDTPAFDASAWAQASAALTPPAGKLTAQMQPPIRATKVLKAVQMTESRPGVFVFDLGQNFAGVVRLRVSGPAGTCIRIRTGEDVYSDGSLNVMTSVAGQLKTVWGADREAPGRPQTAWQEDSYTLRGGDEEVWSPRFTFHGGRYVELTGWPGRPTLGSVEGIRLNADLRRTGFFECSNEQLNRLNQVLENTFLSNVFSVQSDCPAREKFGYGGDIVGVARTFCWFFDMDNFYRKALRDFAHDQRPAGGMTETAPYNGIGDQGFGDGSGPIGWQLAFPFMQDQLYGYYGDKSVIETHYAALKKQVDFLRTQAKEGIIDYCINDHESLEERIPALFATAHYYHHALLLTRFSALTGRMEDATHYQALCEEIQAAFQKHFCSGEPGLVGNGTQGAQAIALYYGLAPDKEAAFKKLLEAIEARGGHVACGIFGVPAMLEVLSREGRGDVAYEMVCKKEFPGWGHMLENGATTLWETWAYSDNVYSHNHPMFGSVGEWFYTTLGGIRASAPGFSQIEIRPQPAGDLEWVRCRYESVRGPIVSSWKRSEGKFTLEVTIPANTTARVWLPASAGASISEGGKPVAQVSGVTQLERGAENACFEVGSGSYRFEVSQ